jgi:hypothetical protein
MTTDNAKKKEASLALAQARKNMLGARKDIEHSWALLGDIGKDGELGQLVAQADSGAAFALSRMLEAMIVQVGRMSKRIGK